MSLDHVTLATLFILFALVQTTMHCPQVEFLKGLGALKKDITLCVEVGGQGSGETPG